MKVHGPLLPVEGLMEASFYRANYAYGQDRIIPFLKDSA